MKEIKQKPRFKKGQKVVAETLGRGVIVDSYLVKNKYLYHIQQGELLLGNVPEGYIFLTPQ